MRKNVADEKKEQRQEKWLRKVIAMATCEERKDRIPEIKMLRTLLMVTDDSGRERKRACRAADFTMSGSCTAHSCTFRARTQSRNFTKKCLLFWREMSIL